MEETFLYRILDREIKSLLKGKTPHNTDFKYRGFHCNLNDKQQVDDIFKLKAHIDKINNNESLFVFLLYEKITGTYEFISIYRLKEYRSIVENLYDSKYFQFRIVHPNKDLIHYIKYPQIYIHANENVFACPQNAEKEEIDIAINNQMKYRDDISKKLQIKKITPSIIDKSEPIKICKSFNNLPFAKYEFLLNHQTTKYLQIYLNNECLETLLNGKNLLINNQEIKLFIGTKSTKNIKVEDEYQNRIKVYSDILNFDEYGNHIKLDNKITPTIIDEDLLKMSLEEYFSEIHFDPNCYETFTIFLEEIEIEDILDYGAVYMKLSHQNVVLFLEHEENEI